MDESKIVKVETFQEINTKEMFKVLKFLLDEADKVQQSLDPVQLVELIGWSRTAMQRQQEMIQQKLFDSPLNLAYCIQANEKLLAKIAATAKTIGMKMKEGGED